MDDMSDHNQLSSSVSSSTLEFKAFDMRYKNKFFSFESWKTWCPSIFDESLHKQILLKGTGWFGNTIRLTIAQADDIQVSFYSLHWQLVRYLLTFLYLSWCVSIFKELLHKQMVCKSTFWFCNTWSK